VRQFTDDLRLMPRVEGQEHVRSHQQPQLRVGVLLMQHAQGVAGVAFAGVVQLDIAGLGHTAHRGRHQRRHVVPLPGRHTGRQRLVGRHAVRDDQQLIQSQLVHGGTGHGHMAVMGRVERPAEHADPHACFALTSCIFRFSLLC